MVIWDNLMKMMLLTWSFRMPEELQLNGVNQASNYHKKRLVWTWSTRTSMYEWERSQQSKSFRGFLMRKIQRLKLVWNCCRCHIMKRVLAVLETWLYILTHVVLMKVYLGSELDRHVRNDQIFVKVLKVNEKMFKVVVVWTL